MAKQGTGVSIQVRLYMEGCLLENAMVNVSTAGNTGGPASCRLELVPTNTIRHIMPGTWIHVFTTDSWELNPAGDLSDFKLLFEGIVVGRGFTRMDDGRNFVVECLSPEIYWTSAKQFWLSIGSANGNIVDQLAVQTSGGYARFGKISSTGTSGYMMSKLAFARKDTDQAEERFIDTLVAVLDDIGNVNPYYTNARNRMRLTDRIIRAPAGKTEKLFLLSFLGDFLDAISGRTSGQSDLVQVVNQLLSAILHEWVSILAPPYIKATVFDRDVFGNIKRTKHTRKRRGPRGRSKVDIYDFQVADDNIVASIMFKPHVYTIDPPNFNVLFPNMYDQTSYNESFLGETTRLAMKPQLPMVSARATQGMLLQRPAELEIFSALIRDPKRKTDQKRTPDGKYADGAGQAPTFTDYDWTTNEERIRGIVYNFINLAPAPSALTLSDPGKRQPSGTRKGGVPKYLQNVASYEYYKSKFLAREATVQGPYNMRPVPGFPMVVLDDSPSNLNLVCYLSGIHHMIDANGSAMTRYSIKYPRIADEVDYNRPKFTEGFNPKGELDLSLFRDDRGNFHFEAIFDGLNQPPVPEWFDESFRNTRDLDLQYQKWFGDKAGVMQGILFRKEESADTLQTIKDAADVFDEVGNVEGILAAGAAGITAFGDFLKTVDDETREEIEKIQETNENISVEDAIDELNRRFRLARGFGKEFEEAARFTARNFTKIDEAFRFIGAAPAEIIDKGSFEKVPANSRTIDYKKMRLDKFVGDISAGSGYSARGDADEIVSFDEEGEEEDRVLTNEAENRMSGAFPVFDTIIHTGTETSDQKIRQKVAKEQDGKSDRARYDGRPLMYDFEFRLWQESLKNAGFTPSGEDIADGAILSDYTIRDEKGGVVRPRTPEERLEATVARVELIEKKKQRDAARKKQRRHNPTPRDCKNMAPKDQAPTGDGLEEETKKPLPQPLSEKQVVDLRRLVIEAYQEELKRTRGFSG